MPVVSKASSIKGAFSRNNCAQIRGVTAHQSSAHVIKWIILFCLSLITCEKAQWNCWCIIIINNWNDYFLEKKQNNWQTLCKFTYISDFGIACKLSCHFVVNPIEIIFSVILLWIQRLWNGLWRLSYRHYCQFQKPTNGYFDCLAVNNATVILGLLLTPWTTSVYYERRCIKIP